METCRPVSERSTCPLEAEESELPVGARLSRSQSGLLWACTGAPGAWSGAGGARLRVWSGVGGAASLAVRPGPPELGRARFCAVCSSLQPSFEKQD